MVEIGLDVSEILDSGRNSHQVFTHAHPLAHFWGDISMGGDPRIKEQGVNVA